MKILMLSLYVVILVALCIIIDKTNQKFGSILACDKKVKAKHCGFERKQNAKGSSQYKMKVLYEYGGNQYTTLLIDNHSLSYFGKHASKGEQDVYIDPNKPQRAVLFRTRLVVKYSIFYTLLVVLSVLDCILFATSIF